jgi:gliding motility-associated-like protein
MLNPKAGEYMIDPASGSCGFPVHVIFHIIGHLFSNEEIPEDEKNNVLRIFGIDFDEKAVRVARTLNLIAGDGETNVLHMNSLDYERWNENYLNNRQWLSTYGEGFERLEKLKKSEGFKDFNFDIVIPCIDVFIPSLFSPNNDQLNDTWVIIGSCIQTINTKIFNQWGELLFESNDMNTTWDGFYQGSKVMNDNYTYTINVRYNDGTSENFNGFVTVID